MGHVRRFAVEELADSYGITTFVETGTGRGDGLAAVLDSFDDLLSCEMHSDVWKFVEQRFALMPHVRLFHCQSDVFMADVCRILPQRAPLMFWLDAHFPGADYGYAAFTAEANGDIRLPLQWELQAIVRYRPHHRDVILIDDARIWLDGPFAHGNVPADFRAVCPAARNIDFITRAFEKTHHIDVLYEHEGYIRMLPK